MNLFIFKKVELTNFNEFVQFWSEQYSYVHEAKYTNNIDKQEHSEITLEQIFEWKNGMILSKPKKVSFNKKILPNIDFINKWKASNYFDLSEFNEVFKDVSAVWKILLLHIIKPNEYPVYDQNVHRAYNYLHSIDFKNVNFVTMSKRKKEQFYFKTYVKFIHINKGEMTLKKVDEALFSFGKFLKNRLKITLNNN